MYPVTFSGHPVQVKTFPNPSHSCNPIWCRYLGSQFSRLNPSQVDIDLLPILLHSKQEDCPSLYHACRVRFLDPPDMGPCFHHHLPTSPSASI